MGWPYIQFPATVNSTNKQNCIYSQGPEQTNEEPSLLACANTTLRRQTAVRTDFIPSFFLIAKWCCT
jgi:hypothetical protein